jgi:hypothetical protein
MADEKKITTLADLIEQMSQGGKTPEQISSTIEQNAKFANENLADVINVQKDIGSLKQSTPKTLGEYIEQLSAAGKTPEQVSETLENTAKFGNKSVDDLIELQKQIKSLKSTPPASPFSPASLAKTGSKVVNALGPVSGALPYVEATKASNELFNEENLNLLQKMGKGLKVAGGSASAASPLLAMGTGGIGAIPAAGVGVAGAGIYGAGELMEQAGTKAKQEGQAWEDKNAKEYQADRQKTLANLPSREEIEGLRNIPEYENQEEKSKTESDAERYKKIYDYNYKWKLSMLGSSPTRVKEAEEYALSKAEDAKKADDLLKLKQQKDALAPQTKEFSAEELMNINKRRESLGLGKIEVTPPTANTAAIKLGLQPLEKFNKYLVGQTPPSSSGLTSPSKDIDVLTNPDQYDKETLGSRVLEETKKQLTPDGFIVPEESKPYLFGGDLTEEDFKGSGKKLTESDISGIAPFEPSVDYPTKKYTGEKAPEEYKKMVTNVLKEYDLENDPTITPSHVLRTMEKESGFDQSKVGPTNDHGLMQITPQGFAEVKQRYNVPWSFDDVKKDPEKNVRTAILLMKANRDFYNAKTPFEQAAMYNGGPNAIKNNVKGALNYASDLYSGVGAPSASKATADKSTPSQPTEQAGVPTASAETPDALGVGEKLPEGYTSVPGWKGVPFQRPEQAPMAKAMEEEPEEEIEEEAPVEATVAPLDLSGGRKLGFEQLLNKALEMRQNNLDTTNIFRALASLGAATAGMDTKTAPKMEMEGFFKDLTEQAGSNLEALKSKLTMMPLYEETDPNSPKAQSYRNVLEKVFKIPQDATEGLSLKEMKELTTPLANIEKVKTDREIRNTQRSREFVKSLRKELTSGELGKQFATYNNATRTVSFLDKYLKEPSIKRSGSKDLVAFMSAAKAIQQDDSVVREAEQKFVLNLGGLGERMRGSLAKFFRGEVLDEGVRKQLRDALRLQQKNAHEQYMRSIRPVMLQAQEEGVDPRLITNTMKEMGYESSGILDLKKRNEYAKQYYDSDEFKRRFPNKEDRKNAAISYAERLMREGKLQ